MYVSSASQSLQQLLLHLSCDALTLPMPHPGCSLLPVWGAPTNYTLYMEAREQGKGTNGFLLPSNSFSGTCDFML